jgi:hypothetical protein
MLVVRVLAVLVLLEVMLLITLTGTRPKRLSMLRVAVGAPLEALQLRQLLEAKVATVADQVVVEAVAVVHPMVQTAAGVGTVATAVCGF